MIPDYVLFAIVVIGAMLLGAAIGFVLNRYLVNSAAKATIASAENLLADAERQAENLRKEALVEAKDTAHRLRSEADKEIAERQREVKTQENRLIQKDENLEKREDNLDKREENLNNRISALDSREHQLSSLSGQLERRSRDLEEVETRAQANLERIARLTTEEAQAELLNRVKAFVVREEAMILREAEESIKAESDKKSREIISLAIQRVAADHTVEHTVSSVTIPSDDVKGRIIGREGRNIRSFEQITGINLIIDDTPEVVVLSSFDPVRREIGRLTLENLIADGRIHPARIEETFKKATDFVDQQVKEAGEQTAFDAGIHDLHPELIRTLGRLKFRTSYGQNVLNHSLEVAHLAGVMASELGIDPTPARRAGLLHDLGKAIDHEVEGSHALIGADLARRFGESPEIVHAIEAHHDDVAQTTIIAVLVQAADAISAARPGARRESLESYIKRLEKLESIANAYQGVEKTYAMQAGREVRVMVEPDTISDDQAVVLAHDIARQIEDEMEYPGQIKVLVIRESRAEDLAK